MTKFTHRVDEETEHVRKRESWEAEINGYEVIASRDGDDWPLVLRIYAKGADRLYMGLIDCRPRSVTELERFADAAPALFRAIAASLREALGTDDLRNRWEKSHDEMMASFRGKP